jgi:hypothetical protein
MEKGSRDPMMLSVEQFLGAMKPSMAEAERQRPRVVAKN